MEKVSQERLSLADLHNHIGHIAMELTAESYGRLQTICNEIKRLQSIEEALIIGKASVKSIHDYWDDHDGPAIYSGQTITCLICDVLDHLSIEIEGVTDHE